ncbi:23S rRNA (adenine(2030)-N(6))-methyltransferase RlmJ [Ramlibacter sp.]|uniref:23S rRNA (adenine(2030)-N(6))-methyltransferase RlmJ n=1 Tax=Ramlibacter sp. TaxID=1917967 RepID=UPI0017B899D9|nr:23S rRNA (adenine(2030)-N(6))-methyltransferase RlmJ [Ramlibacter sp.]MBA2675374.1 23S rRNA (adenine(2030)-N(6))-methyltransferase RlmJ [Ramlibacter sp.]
MFSYRHAFHAGNHADVLKHTALIAVLKHLTTKDTPLTVVDTHAGAGLYRLDSEQTGLSGEAGEGIVKLVTSLDAAQAVPAVKDYLDLVASFNKPGELRVYPGSPFVTHSLLRQEARDKLRLFELHPADSRALAGHVAQMEAGRQVTLKREDGFEGLKALLPPPARRALVLIDPSYEIKNDYGKVPACLQDSLRRFATGTYFVWYPVIPRPEAHELPRRLKTLSNQVGKPWLHATLSIGQSEAKTTIIPGEPPPRPGLTASGVFVINPPHTLKPALQQALPQLVEALGRGRGKGHVLESS